MKPAKLSPTEVPEKIYKYANESHAREMVDEGVFYIHLLQHFVNTDEHGKGIGDGLEAVQFVMKDDRSSVEVITAPNRYCFSTSKEYSNDVSNALGKKYVVEITDPNQFFQYLQASIDDSNVEKKCKIVVHDPLDFRNKSKKWISEKKVDVQFLKMGEMNYNGKFSPESNKIPPMPEFIKEESFIDQKEFRCIWQTSEHFQGIKFVSPEAVKLCRLLEAIE